MADNALIEEMADEIAWAIGEPLHSRSPGIMLAAQRALAAIRKTHAVVPVDQAHDARAWEMVAQTMERSRDDVRSALRELLDAYSAYFPPGNPWGDKARKTLGSDAPVFEGHDPTNPFAPRERPKKSIRLENLREATRSANMLNIHHSQGASGFRGVHFNKARGKYSAKIRVNYKLHHLGFFATAEMAAEAYRKAKADVSVFS